MIQRQLELGRLGQCVKFGESRQYRRSRRLLLSSPAQRIERCVNWITYAATGAA